MKLFVFGEPLKNVFRNYIRNRRIKIDYRKAKCITPKILAALKKRSKLSEKCYANPSLINKEKLNTNLKYCSETIIDARDKFLN